MERLNERNFLFMRPSCPSKKPPVTWQQELAKSCTNYTELLHYLKLDPSTIPLSPDAIRQFPLRVTYSFLSRIEKGNPFDPLLLQIIPSSQELINHPDFIADPVGDIEAKQTPGLLHKYHGRILLLTTAGCSIHCRYCFRREYPYSQNQLGKSQEQKVINYISTHPEIGEVILSGGDPLFLSDSRLSSLVSHLETIPHLKRLRIHTRFPITLPSRVNHHLVKWLTNSRFSTVIVLHTNHPNELNCHVSLSLLKLRETGATLLNQSVLLKGVNDNEETLCKLSEKLFANGVLPYYLHLLDKTVGTHQFDLPETKARALYHQIRNKLPGYLVPLLVRENAGAPCKSPVI